MLKMSLINIKPKMKTIISFRFNQDVEKEKKHYQLIADEEYVFSRENFRLLSAKLTAKEISNFHNDGIYDYQYSITQKE